MAFEPIRTEYVPTVDLNTVGKSLETLTNRRYANIEAASKIDAAIGAMPVNEKESKFKRELAAKAEFMVNENPDDISVLASVYNMVGPANNAVAKRIKAQQNYLAFQKEVDSNNKISADYKRWIKEKNPYVLGTEEEPWKQSFNYTETIPLSDHFENAIKNIVKSRTGGGSSVRYYDAAGNVLKGTKGAMSAAYYKESSGTWERLTPKEIEDAVRISIKSTPGAQLSLHQDYLYASDNNLLEDRNGFKDNEEQWLDRQIKEFAIRRQVNNSHHTEGVMHETPWYTRALANKENAHNSAMKMGKNGVPLMTGNNIIDASLSGGMTGRSGMIETSRNAKAAVEQAQKNVRGVQTDFSNTIKNINKTAVTKDKNLKIYSFHDTSEFIQTMKRKYQQEGKGYGPGTAVNDYINKYLKEKGVTLTKDQKNDLRYQVMTGWSYKNSYNDIINAAGIDRDAVDLYTRMSSNVDPYFNGNATKYEKQITSEYNKLFKNHPEGIKIQIDSDTMKKLKTVYGVDNIGNINSLFSESRSGNDYVITVKDGAKSDFIKLALNIYNSDINTGSILGNAVRGMFTGARTRYQINNGEFDTTTHNPRGFSITQKGDPIGKIASILSEGLIKGEEKLQKMQIGANPQSYETYGLSTYTAVGLEQARNAGFIDTTEYNRRVKNAAQAMDNLCGSSDFDPTTILYGKGNEHRKDVTDDKKQASLMNLLRTCYTDPELKKYIRRKAAPIYGGANATDSYEFTINAGILKNTKLNDSYNELFDGKETITIITSGGLKEEAGSAYMQDFSAIARNIVYGTRNTKLSRSALDYDTNGMGNTSIRYTGNGTYEANFGKYKNIINEQDAENYQLNVLILNQVKNSLYSLEEWKNDSDFNQTIYNEQRLTLAKTLQDTKNNISKLMGVDVQKDIEQYLQRVE